MSQKITEALEDVNLIKKVLYRTQNDFSKVSNFFIGIGAVQILTCFLYVLMLEVMKSMESISLAVWRLFWGISFVSTMGYFIVYLIYHYKLKQFKNELSMSLINIWGMLLVGGELFRMFINIASYERAGNNQFIQPLFSFTFVIIGCFVMGFVMQDKLIQKVSLAMTILFLILAGTDLAVPVADFHGNAVKINAITVFTKVILSVGMILMGFYLRKRRGEK
ncbi:MAG: hypothetical protein NC121_06185 [Blautia sp.]|nr:hypothetical protein [Blautia sp.]